MNQKNLDNAVCFPFGANCAIFLSVLNEYSISDAVKLLQTMLGVLDLNWKTFLNLGFGSAFFSFAARRLSPKSTPWTSFTFAREGGEFLYAKQAPSLACNKLVFKYIATDSK
jgi:hypothetical protein